MFNYSYLPKIFSSISWKLSLVPVSSVLLLLGACQNSQTINQTVNRGLEIRFLAGSDLKDFCDRAATKLNNSQPKLEDGTPFYLTCDTKGSGDVVDEVLNLTQQLQSGAIAPEDSQFPTLISVDGEIYQSQLIFQINKIFPGQNYIPDLTESPLLAYSPMVFMTQADLAGGLAAVDDLYVSLVEAKNHQDLDSKAAPLPITYVHTAPTRSNSGLQTLVAQFASVSGKRPQELTIADVKKYQDRVQKIQNKITRYGKSTGSLAKSMVKNGPFWASVGSVYESLVISANSQGNNTVNYQAVYPSATFSSNIRAILPNAPWVSEKEKAAGEKVIEFLRQPETQKIAVDLGLRPGIPGVPLGSKFSPQFGVQANPQYDSYRPPKPEVVEAMLQSWQSYAKKPSQVALVVDVSGSMRGEKLSGVQNTLLNYVQNLGSREKIAIIPFSNEIKQPFMVEGTPQGKAEGIKFIGSLKAGGGTRLYDSAIFARNWLKQNFKTDAINAVLILTDGQDSGSEITLDNLSKQLQSSNFEAEESIAFFTVGYGKQGEFSPKVLQTIAEVNGGYYRQGNPETISKLIADLQVEF
ncbi:extracellular solute-binding protein [Moorena producens JHB]|uniref:Extracellular solute-binding protein n=1 Tax=Moorena producens (strain JHB) TaxID=1454205 RepID=A0A1D9FZC8_MOOP1|nr:extracellular solute-binding protein [Moorena producens]AOY80624.1 extracellular solute-binding protein [Moorena producens JHB]